MDIEKLTQWLIIKKTKYDKGSYIQEILDEIIKEANKDFKKTRSTGIFDKKSKELVEGDIFLYKNSIEWGIGEVLWNEGYLRFDVRFVKPVEETTQLFYFQCRDEIEIIGNVDENSDLLEV